MKEFGLCCAVVLVVLGLDAAWRIVLETVPSDANAESGEQSAEYAPWRVQVYRDPETGCEYVAGNAAASALTPRLGVDGRPMCGGEGER